MHAFANENGLNHCSILIAEDSISSRQVALGLLRMLGFIQIEAFDNGQQVIAAMASKRYHIVLMDIHMPIMNGLAATQIIRNPTSLVLDHDIPIVAITGCV
jgi:CheY-like chemotaxis protein